MKILAIDTALGAVSACVLDDESGVPEAQESLAMERGHAEALLPLIDRVMARVAGGFPALGRVAVTVGPGSFTGLRVGVAAARAIGLACEIPVVGVSTLAAFAAPLIIEQQPGLTAVAIDARHGNVYFTAFGPDGRAILSPRIAPAREAARSLGAGPVRIVGSGAPMLAAEAAAVGTDAEIVDGIAVPDIVFVAKVGLLADPLLSPPRPLYLKAPDAKPQETKVHDVKPPVPAGEDHGLEVQAAESLATPAIEDQATRDLPTRDLPAENLPAENFPAENLAIEDLTEILAIEDSPPVEDSPVEDVTNENLANEQDLASKDRVNPQDPSPLPLTAP
ncbi:tRNA (adenosine(37)-N6)-threonylcarbamoyltransferase complex dimerization subunit type 1 TsaB [Methylocapsa palsarum]|uniref:N(6)-L-threonylcarbamoyladenine synthase n=1 Tax=Methylocapsa palsarum TaxID=1612308 RepID=A0A1I3Z6F3_9HYPH|nr:tRNA threonylcarbamoyl adenosine modification protein YeaZ [Methylocapsa palsarum]